MNRARSLPAALALSALVLLAGCASVGQGPGGTREMTVDAEGWAPLSNGENLLSTKHRALAEAQKKAVEKAVGVMVKAHTRVDNAINIKESIEANLGGTIRSYDVLSEGAEGDFYKMRIRAIVLYRPHNAKSPRATRVSVRLPSETVSQAVRMILASEEFPLADSDRDADVIVTGVVETYGRADLRLGGFFSQKAKVSLDIADVRTGQVAQREFEGTGLDLEDRVAADLALDQAGRLAGETLVQMLGPATPQDSLVRDR